MENLEKTDFEKLKKRLIVLKKSIDFLGIEISELHIHPQEKPTTLSSFDVHNNASSLAHFHTKTGTPKKTLAFLTFKENNKFLYVQLLLDIHKVVLLRKEEVEAITKDIFFGKNFILITSEALNEVDLVPVSIESLIPTTSNKEKEKGESNWKILSKNKKGKVNVDLLCESKIDTFYLSFFNEKKVSNKLKQEKEQEQEKEKIVRETVSFRKGYELITMYKDTALKIPFLVPILQEKFKTEKDENGAYVIQSIEVSLRSLVLAAEKIEKQTDLRLLMLKELFSDPSADYYFNQQVPKFEEFNEDIQGFYYYRVVSNSKYRNDYHYYFMDIGKSYVEILSNRLRSTQIISEGNSIFKIIFQKKKEGENEYFYMRVNRDKKEISIRCKNKKELLVFERITNL